MKLKWSQNRKYRFLEKWGLMRSLRLVLGAFITFEAILTVDFLLGVFGGILLLQSFFNAGCCGSSICDAGHNYNQQTSEDERNGNISFEEIK